MALPGNEDLSSPEQIEIYRKMTPAEKIRQAGRLYWQAWEIKKAGLRMLHPDWTDEQVTDEVRKIFIRTVT